VNGFSSPTISSLVVARQQQQQQREPPPLRLNSSPLNTDDDDDDDELSRLIGKRGEIKRKINKKKSAQGDDDDEPTPESLEFDISEDDLDWDELPEFKTKRVARNKPKPSDVAKKKKDDEDRASGLDLMADYADEGEFHIPNRIGISTVAWGDVSRGFTSGGTKLTKKMRREGKFVPGDLQVRNFASFFVVYIPFSNSSVASVMTE
jgi:hypothetical protein